MVKFVGYKPLDIDVQLREIGDRIYITKNNFYSRTRHLQEGARVFLKNSNNYSLFKIIESWDNDKESHQDYIERLIKSISDNS